MTIEPKTNPQESESTQSVPSCVLADQLSGPLLGSRQGDHVEFPRDRGIHQLIELQVQRTPNRTALLVGSQLLTYRQLDERANRLAGLLQNLGVGSDIPVGVCLNRSVELMVGLLGVLKAGGCYVPLDPTYPPERLALMLADAKPQVLLTRTSQLNRLGFENADSRLLCVDEANGGWSLINPKSTAPSQNENCKSEPLRNSISESNESPLAYIIYTSGSTGRPKGVMITHRNVANFFAGMDHVIGKAPGVWLAVTSISFDISVLELFWTLARGFTVVLRSEETGRSDTPELSIPEQILQRGITHFQCTPSLLGSLLRMPSADQAIGQLRKLLVGGEALSASLAKQIRQFPGPELLNMYGPTETTVWSAAHIVTEVPHNVPIGHPIANTKIFIFDEQQQPLTNGEAGELFIGGEGVARGYFQRPELTVERFVRDPFSPDPAARLYRTGDIGRYRPDGALEFLGRADHQVKLSGHRIELGEIESALREHSEVRDCVVHLQELGAGEKRLVAYFVPTHASKTLTTTLRRFLETRLPLPMIPSAFVPLEKMPLTPNGKIDRNSLPPPDELRPELETPFVSPRRQIEETVAGIWRNALHLDQVGVHDNFFDLGGNSLLLMEIHAKVCAALGVAPPVIRFFEHPSVSALTRFLTLEKVPTKATQQQRAGLQSEAFARRSREEVAQ